MVAPLLDAVFAQAAELTQVPGDRACLTGFWFGALADDARSLLLSLDADRYRSFDLAVDIADERRKGQIMLILPDPPAPVVADPDPEQDRSVQLRPALMQVPVDLTVVLSRMRMPLAEFAAMQPGDILKLMLKRLDQVELVGLNSQTVAQCHLGQAGGLRAVRVNECAPVLSAEELKAVSDGSPSGSELFAPHSTPPTNAQSDPLTQIQLPAVAEQKADMELSAMSPEEAAMEISQLAGITLEDTAEPTDPTEDVA